MSTPLSPAEVLDALRPIIDPDLEKNIVDLGFVKNLRIDGGRVSFAIELTTPACPVKAEFETRRRANGCWRSPASSTSTSTMTSNTRGRGRAAPTAEATSCPG